MGLLGMVLAGLVAEGAARLAFPRWKEFNAERVQTTVDVAGHGPVAVGRAGFDGWVAQSNGDFRAHVRINAAGWRDNEPAEAADGRLWALGESFAFGWGVETEESFGAIAARALGMPFYNVASPMADLIGGQALLARMPSTVHPRAVVLGLSVETDLRDYEHPPEIATTPPHTATTRLKNAAKQSALCTLVAQVIVRVNGSNDAPVAVAPRTVDDNRIAAILESSLAKIGQIRAMVPAEAPFVVLVIPARDELRNDNAEYRALRLGLTERLKMQGIAVADPFEALAAAGEGKVYFRHDGRWSAQGHRLAGEAVAQALTPTSP
ncbi:hypothetical protein PHAMO_280016 [Magnetospirillum molischianum DSM 120]|uniref:AlgX/AlgJ SGNH hydrolase-like domain-containing protein n=2 Tax=Magnetospirillum molischianum TaxID=1083 RepID=H8FSZ4_MAGML|nr:hypothetical protein PHAMO_280016 [Magnetospirillum molischianum DSM 120]